MLYKEAWRLEVAAMGNSILPTALDKLCMVANINVRNLIEPLTAEIKIRENNIGQLEEMIDSLEDKIKDQNCRLEVLYSKSELLE